MKEELYFAWSFDKHGGPKAAMAMLQRCELRHVAKQDVDIEIDDPYGDPEHPWRTGASGCVRLAKDDPRVPLLVAELRKAGIKPDPFLYRTYTKKELESLPWLQISGSSTMVVAGSVQGQVWDYRRACAMCGAGAIPVPPLITQMSQMSKQGWIVSAPAALVVISRKLGKALTATGLTGFALEEVRLPRRKSADERYWWLRVTSQWPTPKAGPTCRLGNPCAGCGRPVLSSARDEPRELYYDAVPAGARDFNMWQGNLDPEFGHWGPRPSGETPILILSQKAFRTLKEAGVKALRCAPVHIGN